MRPDVLDHQRAFNMGWRHGRDVGATSPREAEAELLRLIVHTSLGEAVTSSMVDCFCAGNDDGVRGDTTRYIAFAIIGVNPNLD